MEKKTAGGKIGNQKYVTASKVVEPTWLYLYIKILVNYCLCHWSKCKPAFVFYAYINYLTLLSLHAYICEEYKVIAVSIFITCYCLKSLTAYWLEQPIYACGLCVDLPPDDM